MGVGGQVFDIHVPVANLVVKLTGLQCRTCGIIRLDRGALNLVQAGMTQAFRYSCFFNWD
jgi:hypothetical protein